MSRRPYHMRKRALTAAQTRQRLVEATFALHTEQGIAATTMHQIAARADVSVGTAYHHFSTYEDAVSACGAYAQEHYRLPGPEALAGHPSPAARLAALAGAYFAWFEGFPVLEHVRREQALSPVLSAFVAGEEAHRRHMVGLALATEDEDSSVVDLVAVLIDQPMLVALKRMGYGVPAAARLISDLAMSWISTRRAGADAHPAPAQEDVHDRHDQ